MGLHLLVADKLLVSGLQMQRPGDLPLPQMTSASLTVHVQGWSRGIVSRVHSVHFTTLVSVDWRGWGMMLEVLLVLVCIRTDHISSVEAFISSVSNSCI